MPVTISSSALGMYNGSSTNFWSAKNLWPSTANDAWYAVIKDSSGGSPKVRIFKSNSLLFPTTWTEQDASNAPTALNSVSAFSTSFNGTYIDAIVATASTTFTHYVFNVTTDTWGTSTGAISTAAAINLVARIARNGSYLYACYSQSADDTDISWRGHVGTAWGDYTLQTTGTSANASLNLDMIADSAGALSRLFFDGADKDFTAMVWSGTVSADGGVVDLTASGSTTHDTAMLGVDATIYDVSGRDTVLWPYKTSTGTLGIRPCGLERTAIAGFMGTATIVESTAANVGALTSVSTCFVNSTFYVAWWDDANSGTIYYATASATTGTWTRSTFITGVTGLIAIRPTGNYLAIIYQSGTDVVFDWITAPTLPGDNGAVATGTHTVNGQTIVGRSGSNGVVATGNLTVGAQAITGRVDTSGVVATGAHFVNGQSIASRWGSEGDVNTGMHVVNGQTIAGRSGSNAVVGTGNHGVTGQPITGRVDVTATVATGTYSVDGQTIQADEGSGAVGDTGGVATGAMVVGGQAIAGATGCHATVGSGTYGVTGGAVSGLASVEGDVASGQLVVAGQAIASQSGSRGAVTTGELLVQSAGVVGRAGSEGDVGTTDYSVTGQSIAGRPGARGAVATGELVVSGQTVGAGYGSRGVVDTGQYNVNGGPIEGEEETVDPNPPKKGRFFGLQTLIERWPW